MSRKKPPHMKVVSGTDQPCRRDDSEPLFEEEPLSEIPQAPLWMPNAHAVNEWNRLAPILHANELLTESCLQSLGVLCAVYGGIVQAYAAGFAPTASQLGQYRALAGDFGLTPLSRDKMRKPEPKQSDNKFGKFNKRNA